MLVSSGGVRSGIEFFDEAGVVNHLLSLGGENLFGQRYVNTFEFSHDPINFGTVNLALNKIGRDLAKQNDEILAALLEAGDKPPSPNYNLVEEMDSPTAARVATAIDWDIHMVWREQSRVQEIIDDAEDGIETKTLEWITDLMTMNASGIPDRDIQEASEAFGWAIVAAGGSLDFAEEEHRRAIGIAMMLRAHGYSEQAFGIYYRAMMRSVAEQAGQDVYRLPTVG